MKKLTEAVKKMLDGLAYEHAGEHLSLKQKTEVLAKSLGEVDTRITAQVHEAAREQKGSNARRVALYMGSELPAEVMEYVIQTCGHMQHELSILTFQTKGAAENLIKPYQEAMDQAGVKMELVTLTGEPMSGLAKYLRSHTEYAFLACKDSGYLGRTYIKGMQGKNALPVPVVVVATGAEAASLKDQTADKDSDAVVA